MNRKHVLFDVLLSAVFVAALAAVMSGGDQLGTESPRSGKWPAIERAVLAEHPECEGCTKKATCVHHVLPFHLWPEKELDVDNLVAVCPDCHLHICHLGDYKAYNPLAREDLARHKAEVKARPYTKEQRTRFEHQFQLAP